jgi:threonine dehydrogenase-like Zn-dependent dehydrogenase
MVATSLWHTDPATSALKSAGLTQEPQDLILDATYSLVSLGTEKIVLTGMVPPELYTVMKVPYMGGSFSFPIKYGYSLIGSSADQGNYHVMHPHQDKVSVRLQDAFKLPASLPLNRAALISNLETACNAYWDGQAAQDEPILIVGFGLIGAAIALWHKLLGHQSITVIEKNDHRRALAKGLGFETLTQLIPEQKFSLAFHCSATGLGLQTCIDQMDFEGRIIELSWYGDKPVSLHLGHYFHYNRLSIISSQVSHIPDRLQATQNYLTRKQAVVNMLQHDIWDQLIGIEVPFHQIIPWYDRLRSGQLNEISLLIKY